MRLYRSLKLVHLHQRGVGALLEGLAEDVALAVGEARLVRIGGGDGAVEAARRKQRKREAGGIQSGLAAAGSPCAGSAGQRASWPCSPLASGTMGLVMPSAVE